MTAISDGADWGVRGGRPAGRLPGDVLLALALLQAAFFVISDVSAPRRAVGIALAIVAAAEWWRPWFFRPRPGLGYWVLAALIAANFAALLVTDLPSQSHRLIQVAVVAGYVASAVAGMAAAVRLSRLAPAMTATMGVGVLLLAGESLLEGSRWRATSGEFVTWSRVAIRDEELGALLAPNSRATSQYPTDPRGYFEDRGSLRRTWKLDLHDTSAVATLDFPDDWASTLRINIARSTAPPTWNVQLNQAPISVRRGEQYILTFRARASTPRTIVAGVAQNHAPWQAIGLHHAFAIDTSWSEFRIEFTGGADDDRARLHFDVAGEPAVLELARINLRRLSSGDVVTAVGPTVHTVEYRSDGLGCRGEPGSPARHRGSTRVVVVGGGDALGIGVHREDTFSARLEQVLRADKAGDNTAPPATVLNCGVAGFGVREARLFLKRHQALLSPTVVVLALTPDSYAWRERYPLRAAGLADRFDRLVLSPRYIGEVAARWRRPGSDFDRQLAEVQSLHASLAAVGARLLLVSLPIIHDPGRTALTSAMTRALAGTDVSVLDVRAALSKKHDWRELVVHARYDMHPSDLAHALAADAVADWLRRQEPAARPSAH